MKGKNWLYVFLAFIVFLVVADQLSTDEFAGHLDFSSLFWVFWSLLAVVVIYVIYQQTSDSEGWEVGTRQVVYMAIGAALYGIFNWLFNGTTIALPSISLVAYRPSVAILIFFGYAFGPVVGFFTGAVGNILGDFLSGWGVFPTWDIGNGLMGFVAGLPMIYASRAGISKKNLAYTAGILVVAAAVLVLMNANIEFDQNWRGITDFSLFGWVFLVGGVIGLGMRYVMKGDDTTSMNVWGILAIVIGMAYAAIGDIWISGYTFVTTMVGQFAPAASSNIIFAVILAPILWSAYNSVQSRAGR